MKLSVKFELNSSKCGILFLIIDSFFFSIEKISSEFSSEKPLKLSIKSSIIFDIIVWPI